MPWNGKYAPQCSSSNRTQASPFWGTSKKRSAVYVNGYCVTNKIKLYHSSRKSRFTFFIEPEKPVEDIPFSWWNLLLLSTCKMNYIDMQHRYVNLQFIYINMQNNHADMQYLSSQHFISWWLLIPCITVLLTGEQFIDLLPAIELLTDEFIFIDSWRHLWLFNNIKVRSIGVVQIVLSH